MIEFALKQKSSLRRLSKMSKLFYLLQIPKFSPEKEQWLLDCVTKLNGYKEKAKDENVSYW